MSGILVKKYGGTSVGSTERICSIAESLKADHERGMPQVVVLSAMAGETNRLVDLVSHCVQEGDEPDAASADLAYATGEQASIALLSVALHSLGVQAETFCGWQLPIETTNVYGRARITNIETAPIHQALERGRIALVAGFQGISAEGRVSTLGRGGSDTSAVALAVSLEASECRIYTDVDGIYTADPRQVPDARRLPSVTFEEMLELSSLGSKVLLVRSVELAVKNKLPIRVLSSFVPGPGTLVTSDEKDERAPPITGLAHNMDEAQLTLIGVPNNPDFVAKALKGIADENIGIDIIAQRSANAGDGARKRHSEFTFTLRRSDFQRVLNNLKARQSELRVEAIFGNDQVAKISLVGVGIRSQTSVAQRSFEALADKGINILTISTSETKISMCINEDDATGALQALHGEFRLGDEPKERAS